ncbi:MAG: peroxide stress protein YaaA [Ilumatobacteraceae bacterium]
MASAAVPLGLLLPPSEGKAVGGDGPIWSAGLGRFPELESRRSTLIRRLARVRGGNEKLLGVGGKHLAAARLANASLATQPSVPAWRRYTGVVWDGFDVASLPADVGRRAMSSVVVVSGLLGLVALDDPIPEYRLKIGASLAPYGKLSTWWRPVIAESLTAWSARRFVVDLLPNEHRAACSSALLRGVSVTFVERSGKVAGHDAKIAKGRLARHVLSAGGHPMDALQSWTDPRFDLLITPLGS